MAGTKEGGAKARETMYKNYGKDFYKKIGAIGGKHCGMKGFALDPELARKAGAKGGKISKRGRKIGLRYNKEKYNGCGRV